MTDTGMVLGTSHYIAPEQASGKTVDAHTDVYSLGVVLYELLAGEVPFPGESFVAVAMKHVHEPAPNLLEKRGDVPPRVAEAVDRALDKDPAQRFQTMAAFGAELEACLVDLERGGAGLTGVIPTPRQRSRKRVSRLPVGIMLLALAAIAAIVLGLLTLGGINNEKSVGTPISLSGIASYDPYGVDKVEHPEKAPNVVDHNPATYWSTERYNGNTLNKAGVGVVVDAHGVVTLSVLTVVTDTPGFTAEILATNVLGGAAQPVSDSRVVGTTTRFAIHQTGGPKRYYIVWITKLPPGRGYAHVNEVSASGTS
jgi:serine/threonine protein kinase